MLKRMFGCFAVVAIALAMHQPVAAQNNADFDGDGTVGFADFLAFVAHFGTQHGDGRYQAKFDLNSDGAIDFSDFLLFASSYGQSVPPSGGDSEIVEIPDAYLRALISYSLGKARDAPITRADMATLTSLRHTPSTGRWEINNLTGLEFATNLDTLNLFGNNISDITALSKLTNLTRLSLGYNQISDIAALAGLTNLTYLSLSGNRISDISALAGLTKLEVLWLSWNRRISDITALSRLTNLTYLFLSNNRISDITALLGLTNLRSLYLDGNPLSVTSVFTHIPAFLARGVWVTF